MMGKSTETLDLGSWFIIRTTGPDTLRVLRMLQKRGFDAWTPIERKRGRMPRHRTPVDKEFALMPSYIFANVHDLATIHHMAAIPIEGQPRFSLFMHRGGVPLIGDDQLDALRAEEGRLQRVYDRAVQRGKRGPKFDRGQVIRIKDGPFAGLGGVVQEQRGQFTLVNINGFHNTLQIRSLLLLDEFANGAVQVAA